MDIQIEEIQVIKRSKKYLKKNFRGESTERK